MKIVNLLYDQAFKYLMDNEELAKIVISIILEEKIISLQVKSVETPMITVDGIDISRYDFKAILRNENNVDKEVLIEVQKYKSPNPVARFRTYLAQNYMKEEIVINKKGKEVKKMLPIIAIYILGFDLPEYDTCVIKMDPRAYDVINKKFIETKKTSRIVDLLTHKTYFLIAAEKPDYVSTNTRLEKFLNLFNQKLIGDEADILIDIDNENSKDDNELEKIINYLNKATLDQLLIRKLKYESEHENAIKDLITELSETKQREEEAKQREENERKQKKEAEQREENERKQKKEAEQREKDAKIKLAKKMKEYKIQIAEIILETGFSKEEIEKL